MPGPLPKDPKIRRRTNRSPTRATFEDDGNARPKRKPDLPKNLEWHSMTRRWWDDLWASPMRDEFLRVDVHGLFRLAVLIDRFWRGETDLSAEIRLQGQLFGLTPIDRRRLQWEVARGEEAEERRTRRKPAPQVDTDDPRKGLRAVS